MNPKFIGCCSKCDKEVFKVERRNPETRAPVTVSTPYEDAERLTFVLVDGTRMDLTFCTACADSLQPGEFPFLWQRVMASWVAESGADHPWLKSQRDNGILGFIARKRFKEIA